MKLRTVIVALVCVSTMGCATKSYPSRLKTGPGEQLSEDMFLGRWHKGFAIDWEFKRNGVFDRLHFFSRTEGKWKLEGDDIVVVQYADELPMQFRVTFDRSRAELKSRDFGDETLTRAR